MMKRTKKRKIKPFDIALVVLMGGFAFLCLYPFLNQLLISFSSKQDFYEATLFVIPRRFTLDSYKFILYQDRIGFAFLVSLFVTVAGTAYNMLLTVLGAYVLAKQGLPGRKIFFVFILGWFRFISPLKSWG